MTHNPPLPPQRRPEQEFKVAVPSVDDHVLAGRVLHLVSAHNHPVVPQSLDPVRTGYALCGPRAGIRVAEVRGVSQVPVVADFAMHDRHLASQDEPLRYPDEVYQTLFGEAGFYDDLRAQGANVIMTPTGFIAGGDIAALKAVRDAVRSLGSSDVVALVPIDVAFLRKDSVDQVIAILQSIGIPIALALGGQLNPTDRYADIVVNLRRICREVPRLGVWRTDMITGFDCMGHGAMFAGIGASTTLRHAPPPDEKTAHFNQTGRPSVLVSDLWGYFKGDTLARRWANSEPLPCFCAICHGRGLDRFDSTEPEVKEEALAHNVASWSLFWSRMQPLSLVDRQAWLMDQVQRAARAYPAENERIQQPDAFKPDKTLAKMAKLATLLPSLP
ncbi:hypothetical protein AB0M43_35010 [Longispora sp. NPDC051575]|uniref:hypothetical protein n=1 Tax=Longispora sp. NPDC051575 TaxID=3154943 RepID=UPI003446D9CC